MGGIVFSLLLYLLNTYPQVKLKPNIKCRETKWKIKRQENKTRSNSGGSNRIGQNAQIELNYSKTKLNSKNGSIEQNFLMI